jgi:hypothetical protein
MSEWMDGAALSEMLGIPPGTLANWRYQGTGPRFYRVGRHVRYKLSDVLDWLETNAREPKVAAAR